VQDVELDRRHRVEVALEHFDRLVVAAHVYEQPAPRKAGLVLNARGVNEVPLAVTLQKLQECFKPAQRSHHGGGFEDGLSVRHVERIRLVLLE